MNRAIVNGAVGRSRVGGQAMTEFVIAASAILIPLFLVIPYIGKVGDLRQSAIQAARYQAWEYTVWYEADPSRGGSFDAARIYPTRGQSLPVRTRVGSGNRERVEGLFLYEAPEIANPASGAGIRNGFETIYGDSPSDTRVSSNEGDTPDPTSVVADIVTFAGEIFRVLGGIPYLDIPAFTKLSAQGYQSASIELDSSFTYPSSPYVDRPPGSTGPDQLEVTVSATAAVLSDNWGAASVDDAQSQTRGLVPTAILGGTIGNALQTVAGTLAFPFGYPLLGTEPDGSGGRVFSLDVFDPNYEYYLEFGHVDFDPLPAGAFEGDDREVACEKESGASGPEPRVCGFRRAAP